MQNKGERLIVSFYYQNVKKNFVSNSRILQGTRQSSSRWARSSSPTAKDGLALQAALPFSSTCGVSVGSNLIRTSATLTWNNRNMAMKAKPSKRDVILEAMLDVVVERASMTLPCHCSPSAPEPAPVLSITTSPVSV